MGCDAEEIGKILNPHKKLLGLGTTLTMRQNI